MLTQCDIRATTSSTASRTCLAHNTAKPYLCYLKQCEPRPNALLITHFNSLVSDCLRKQLISFTLQMLIQEILVHQTLKKTKVSGTKIGNWSLIASRNSSRLPCHKALPLDAFLFICDQILKVSNVIVCCIYDNLATPRESSTAYLVPLVIQ